MIVGETGPEATLTLPIDRGLVGMVALRGKPMALAGAWRDPQHVQDLAAPLGRLPQTLLAVPIVATSGGEILGVLELFDRAEAGSFGLDDIGLLGMFAQHAAFALEQRKVRNSGADFIGRALAEARLPPETHDRLVARAEHLGASGTDVIGQRRQVVAKIVAILSRGGEAEFRLANGVLSSLATYVRDRSSPSQAWDVSS